MPTMTGTPTSVIHSGNSTSRRQSLPAARLENMPVKALMSILGLAKSPTMLAVTIMDTPSQSVQLFMMWRSS